MSDVSVISEPRTYAKDSPHTFFGDVIDAGRGDRSAAQRLSRHSDEVTHEINENSAEGKRAYRQRQLEARRNMNGATESEIDREVRAGTSLSMAGFTTPQYLIEEFAVYRGTQRTFVDQCTKLPLPNVGLQVNIPVFNSQASAGVAPQGSAVVDLDPSAQMITEGIRTFAGQITASQQLIDRGGQDGMSFDYFVYAQLRQSYDQSLDVYTINRALTVGTAVPESSGTFSIANLYQDVTNCREAIYDQAGLGFPATHLFTTSDIYGHITDQLDVNSRPIIIPQFAPGNPLWPDPDVEAWAQFTGTVMPGTLCWFIDNSIPAVNGDTQLIVSRPKEIVVFEGADPIVRVIDQTLAGSLQGLVQLYNYCCVIPRYAGTTAYVTGAAYPTSEK